MAERLPDAPPPRTTYPPVDPTPAIARKNMLLAAGLVVMCLVIAGGAVAASLIYLHYN